MDLGLEAFHVMTLLGCTGNVVKLQVINEPTEVTRQSAVPSKSGSHPRLRNPESMMRNLVLMRRSQRWDGV